MLIPQICEGHGCAEEIEEVNVESWELSGKFLCADCADADFERRANEGAEEYPDPRTDEDWKRHAE